MIVKPRWHRTKIAAAVVLAALLFAGVGGAVWIGLDHGKGSGIPGPAPPVALGSAAQLTGTQTSQGCRIGDVCYTFLVESSSPFATLSNSTFSVGWYVNQSAVWFPNGTVSLFSGNSSASTFHLATGNWTLSSGSPSALVASDELVFDTGVSLASSTAGQYFGVTIATPVGPFSTNVQL